MASVRPTLSPIEIGEITSVEHGTEGKLVGKIGKIGEVKGGVM